MAISFGSHLLMFDGGGGSLRQLPKMGVDFRRIDFHLITHFHPDHVTDLVPLLFALNYTVNFRRTEPLHILGPSGLNNFYQKMQGIFGPWIQAHTYPLHLHEARENKIDFGDFSIETLPMAHSAEAIAFRVNTQGRSVVYSGDTDYCENIVKLGRAADLLILECSFPQEMHKEGHLTPQLAGRIAREAACQKLLLTHFYPVFEGHDIQKECQEEFPGTIIMATDGLKIQI